MKGDLFKLSLIIIVGAFILGVLVGCYLAMFANVK